MRRGLVFLTVTFSIIVGIFFFRPAAEAEEKTLWSGGFSTEVVEETRTFLNGHPCEEKTLKWVKRSKAYWAKHYTYRYEIHTEPRCGLYTDYGFSDGMAYVMNGEVDKAHSIKGNPTNYRHYPNNIVLHLVKTGWDSPYVRLSYFTNNAFGNAPDKYMSTGTMIKDTSDIGPGTHALKFVDNSTFTTRAK